MFFLDLDSTLNLGSRRIGRFMSTFSLESL